MPDENENQPHRWGVEVQFTANARVDFVTWYEDGGKYFEFEPGTNTLIEYKVEHKHVAEYELGDTARGNLMFDLLGTKTIRGEQA